MKFRLHKARNFHRIGKIDLLRVLPQQRHDIWVRPLVRALFGLCLATLLASVVLPASGVILPRLYGGRAATAALFFLLGALLWLTQPDAGP